MGCQTVGRQYRGSARPIDGESAQAYRYPGNPDHSRFVAVDFHRFRIRLGQAGAGRSAQFQKPLQGMAWVALAGPVSNLLMAAAGLDRPIGRDAGNRIYIDAVHL